MKALLVLLQAFHVAFLWAHDRVPLGRLNDIAAVRRQDSMARLVRVTLIQSLASTVGFAASTIYWLDARATPGWLWSWLWISYGVLFAGELTAWWIPYLTRPQPGRAARYRAMFGSTTLSFPNGTASSRTRCTASCTLQRWRRC